MKYYVSSDWHGDVNAFRLCESKLPNTPTTVLLLGDIGLTYGDFDNVYLKELMSKSPHTYVVMRGNHDKRYHKFAKQEKYGWVFDSWAGNIICYQKQYSNILYIKDDGGIYNINGKSCLFIPGAWSIDSQYRQMHGLSWEYDEQLTLREQFHLEVAAQDNKIDLVFSHDCPIDWQDSLQEFFLPIRVKKDISTNIFLHNILTTATPLDKWYFGHYHGNKIVGDGKGELIYQEPVLVKEL